MISWSRSETDSNVIDNWKRKNKYLIRHWFLGRNFRPKCYTERWREAEHSSDCICTIPITVNFYTTSMYYYDLTKEEL